MASLLINPLVVFRLITVVPCTHLFGQLMIFFFPLVDEISTNRTWLWNAEGYTLLLNCWFRAIVG